MSGPEVSSVSNTFFTSSTVVPSVSASTLTGSSQSVFSILPVVETIAVYTNAQTTLTATEVATADGGWAAIDGTTIFVGQAALTLSGGDVLSLASNGIVASGTTDLWTTVPASSTAVNTSLEPVGTAPLSTTTTTSYSNSSTTLSTISSTTSSSSSSSVTSSSSSSSSYSQPIETQTYSSSTVSSSSVSSSSFSEPIETSTSAISSSSTGLLSGIVVGGTTTIQPLGPVIVTTAVTPTPTPTGPVIITSSETINAPGLVSTATSVQVVGASTSTTTSASATSSTAAPSLVNSGNTVSVGKVFGILGGVAAVVSYWL